MTDVYGEFQKFLRANPAEGQKSFFAFNAGWEATEAEKDACILELESEMEIISAEINTTCDHPNCNELGVIWVCTNHAKKAEEE